MASRWQGRRAALPPPGRSLRAQAQVAAPHLNCSGLAWAVAQLAMLLVGCSRLRPHSPGTSTLSLSQLSTQLWYPTHHLQGGQGARTKGAPLEASAQARRSGKVEACAGLGVGASGGTREERGRRNAPLQHAAVLAVDAARQAKVLLGHLVVVVAQVPVVGERQTRGRRITCSLQSATRWRASPPLPRRNPRLAAPPPIVAAQSSHQ